MNKIKELVKKTVVSIAIVGILGVGIVSMFPLKTSAAGGTVSDELVSAKVYSEWAPGFCKAGYGVPCEDEPYE